MEDILDDIAEQVEKLLADDDSLQGTADSSILINTEFEFDSAGGKPVGSCRLTYGVTYYTMSPRDINTQNLNDGFEETGPQDFETNNVEYNIGDDENTREATDTVVQPT